jgi:hypothetical protein
MIFWTAINRYVIKQYSLFIESCMLPKIVILVLLLFFIHKTVQSFSQKQVDDDWPALKKQLETMKSLTISKYANLTEDGMLKIFGERMPKLTELNCDGKTLTPKIVQTIFRS